MRHQAQRLTKAYTGSMKIDMVQVESLNKFKTINHKKYFCKNLL